MVLNTNIMEQCAKTMGWSQELGG